MEWSQAPDLKPASVPPCGSGKGAPGPSPNHRASENSLSSCHTQDLGSRENVSCQQALWNAPHHQFGVEFTC